MDKYLEEEKVLREVEALRFFSENELNTFPKPYNFNLLFIADKLQEIMTDEDS